MRETSWWRADAVGGTGDAARDLYLLAVSDLAVPGSPDDHRFAPYARRLALDDPDWLDAFLHWLRGQPGLRRTAIAAAVEAARGLLSAGRPGGRRVVRSVLRRADDPGEALAYWRSRYGPTVAKPVRRGIADAVTTLYDERAVAGYDVPGRRPRFGDVIAAVHPVPLSPVQSELFRHAIERRGRRSAEPPASLGILTARRALARMDPAGRASALDSDLLRRAALGWPSITSWYGRSLDHHAWAAVLPLLSYRQLLRHLGAFDRVGLPDSAAEAVMARLADPAEVAEAGVSPLRIYRGYRMTRGRRWDDALDQALRAAAARLPRWPGRSLILFELDSDTWQKLPRAQPRGDRTHYPTNVVAPSQLATLLGGALALSGNDVEVVGSDGRTLALDSGDRLLPAVAAFGEIRYPRVVGPRWGRRRYGGYDRVLTAQALDRFSRADTVPGVPESVTWYRFNYRRGQADRFAVDGRHHVFWGLTDGTERLIPYLEAGHAGAWPW